MVLQAIQVAYLPLQRCLQDDHVRYVMVARPCEVVHNIRMNGNKKTSVSIITVFLAAITIQTLSALPLEGVTLYTSGVGEFVHRGEVSGSGSLAVSVPADAMSDVIRSLTLIDHDGGTVEAVGFPTGEDTTTRLARFPVNLTHTHRLHHVLRQMRGTTVELIVVIPGDVRGGTDSDRSLLSTPGSRTASVTGVLIGAEENTVLLAQGERIREVPLWQIESVRFSDSRAGEEFRAAVEALASEALETNVRDLSISYTGSGSRTLEIRYLVEMPRWHTTYRVIVEPGTDEAHLQGWIHLDNTGAIDWESVRLSLVSAQPITYRFDLYEPRYVERPPYVQEDALDPIAPPARVSVESMMMRSAVGDRVASSVAPAVATEQLQPGMVFTLTQTVSVARGRSLMVPLVNRAIPLSIIRYYDSRRDGEQPRTAFRITNSGETVLPAGPVAVYENTRYVGDGAIPVLLPGATTIVTYARDPDLRVTASGDTGEEQLITTRIIDGVLVAEHRTRHTTSYHVRSATGILPGRDGSAPLLVSHPLRSGWELVSPRGADIQGTIAIVAADGPGVTVVEERIRSQRYSLTDLDERMLISFSSNRIIDPSVRRSLQNIATLRRTLGELRRSRRTLEERRDAIFADQERISSNMAQLDRNSALYRRYTSDLARQEEELRTLKENLADAQREERNAENALREYLRTLGVD